MYINQITIPFIIILGLLLLVKDNKLTRLFYITVCSVALLFIVSLRHPEWMTKVYSIDTLVYKDYFESTFDISWKEIWRAFYMRYFNDAGEYDAGYIVLNKLISMYTHKFWVFSALANLLFFIPFGIILYRFTTNMWQIMFAFVFYVSLLQIFFLGGARQIFAIGFNLMALLSMIDKRRLLSIIFFFVGITLHYSSILFIIPLLMIWCNIQPKNLKYIHIVSFVLFPLALVFPNQLIFSMGTALGVEKFAAYGTGEIQGGAGTFILLIETLSLFCLIAIKNKNMLVNKSIAQFYVMMPLLTFFAPLIISNGTMIRISLYFHLFLTILVPFAIEGFAGKKNRYFIYSVFIFILSFMTLKGGGVWYYFFWQEIPI